MTRYVCKDKQCDGNCIQDKSVYNGRFYCLKCNGDQCDIVDDKPPESIGDRLVRNPGALWAAQEKLDEEDKANIAKEKAAAEKAAAEPQRPWWKRLLGTGYKRKSRKTKRRKTKRLSRKRVSRKRFRKQTRKRVSRKRTRSSITGGLRNH
jgi:hypothetical protein